MIRIGILGEIGSGKSYVAKKFGLNISTVKAVAKEILTANQQKKAVKFSTTK